MEGVISSFADPTTARIVSLVLMSGVLLLRPQGLFAGADAMTRAAAIERTLMVAFAAFMIAVPWLIPAVASSFWVSVIAEILIWSLFAASVNLLFGYVGLLSFGQALYFGFGMYGVAIGIENLGLSFWPAFALGIVAAMAMALATGIFAVRLTWHYFAIITVVFSLIVYFARVVQQMAHRGRRRHQSFTLPPTFAIGSVRLSLADPTFQYLFILAVVAVCFWLKHRLIGQPARQGVPGDPRQRRARRPDRLNVYLLRLIAFVLAGFLAGVAGALFAFFGRYASASYMFYHVSGEAVVWAIVGGAGTLLGPLFGTSIFIIVREVVSTHWEHHALIVGIVAILVVMFAPRGIVGLWREWLARLTEPESGTAVDVRLRTEP